MLGKDAKYPYNESLATEYWLTGDPQALARIPDIRSATITGFAPTSPITLARAATFTERDFAFSLLAAVMEYEVSGSAGAATQAADILTNLHGMQQNPLNSQPANGCFLFIPTRFPVNGDSRHR